MTVPHQSEASVRGRTGFSKIGGLLASVPSVSCPNFRAASLQKIGSKLFCRTGTLATQARWCEIRILGVAWKAREKREVIGKDCK